MWVASGVSITRTISNSTRDGNTSNRRRAPRFPAAAVAYAIALAILMAAFLIGQLGPNTEQLSSIEQDA